MDHDSEMIIISPSSDGKMVEFDASTVSTVPANLIPNFDETVESLLNGLYMHIYRICKLSNIVQQY
jgi:hypothetical protein